jgi:YesN/AraC family two-component response regulator
MIILTQKDDELEINQDDNNSIIFSQIVEYFKEAKPYTNPDLNIQLLAQKINISYKKISSSIKESTNENFNTFVNKYRVEEVKLMLSSEKYKDYSIEAIGYEAGFNSKACFYTAFKKFTEKPPTSYRKDINT